MVIHFTSDQVIKLIQSLASRQDIIDLFQNFIGRPQVNPWQQVPIDLQAGLGAVMKILKLEINASCRFRSLHAMRSCELIAF